MTNGWWESFCKRHPNLTLSEARAKVTDSDRLDQSFDLLEKTIKDNGLADKSCQIFNIDETGISLDPKALKGVYRSSE